MEVRRIDAKMTHEFILTKHYAQRLPSISYAFGLFINDVLEGVLTIGKPASHSLCIGVCGKEYSHKVYELNRLITNDNLPKNALSVFVSKCLRDLKGDDLVIVSYADSGMNHNGYIYQATNFIYTGMTKPRTDKYTPGNKHSRHYTDEHKHLRKVRTGKHRYVFFTNSKNRELRGSLRYETFPYPKGENGRYQLGERIKTKVIDTMAGTEFYE